MKKPVIVDIPEKMEKFFGIKGKMLHPDILMVENLVRLIPLGKITTVDALAKKMAKDFKADISCPLRTENAVKKIIEKCADNASCDKLPFWRVVKKDKTIINSKNQELCSSKLKDDGFTLLYQKSGKIKVDFELSKLFSF